MIITGLVDIISTYSYNFFLVMRTLTICSVSNFQICNSVLLTIITVLYFISAGLITGSLFVLKKKKNKNTPDA